jgi:oligoribonuclease
MSRVHEYLHYRVIDVSSFREMMKRWAPGTASKFARQLASDGGEVVSHRAMDDIIWSIQMMKMFKPLLTSRQ